MAVVAMETKKNKSFGNFEFSYANFMKLDKNVI